tara:strand:- start:1501 stop:2253 length:753 start_codon:yes stop_codon:yes gene_type:complete
MPLILNIQKTLESTDCQYVLFPDQTGNYDAGTNPGGYGAPNDDRADIAIFLIPKLWDPIDNVISTLAASVVTSGNDDPVNATDWILNISEDGYYPIDFGYVHLQSNGLPVDTDEYIYDTVDGQLYRSLTDSNNTAPNVDDTNWATGSPDDEEFETFVTAQNQKFNSDTIILCNSENEYHKFTARVAENLLNNPNKGCPCLDRNRKKWERLHVLYTGALSLAVQNRYNSAGRVAKALTDMFVDINCEDCKC